MNGQTVGQQSAYGDQRNASGFPTIQNGVITAYHPEYGSMYAGRKMSDVQSMLDENALKKSQVASGSDFTGYQNQLNSLLKDPSSFQRTPSYQFQVDQGNQAINRSAAAKGMLGSGNVLAELAKYGQGMANQEYGNQVNMLSGLMGGAQKFGVATDYFKQPFYGQQPGMSTDTSWNRAYSNQQPTSNW